VLFMWRLGNDDNSVSFGRRNFATTLIELAGGEPVVIDGIVSKEAVIALDPDAILITQYVVRGDELQSFYREPAFRSLKAIRNKRVVMYDSARTDLIDVNFSLSGTARKVAMAVHPEWY